MDEPSSCVPAGIGTDGSSCNPTMLGECAEGFDCAPGGACREFCCPEAGITTCSQIGYICQPFSGCDLGTVHIGGDVNHPSSVGPPLILSPKRASEPRGLP